MAVAISAIFLLIWGQHCGGTHFQLYILSYFFQGTFNSAKSSGSDKITAPWCHGNGMFELRRSLTWQLWAGRNFILVKTYNNNPIVALQIYINNTILALQTYNNNTIIALDTYNNNTELALQA